MPHAKRNPQQKRLFKQPQWDLCYQQFLDSLPSPATRKCYNYILRQFFADGLPPDKKTRADVEAFITQPGMGLVKTGQEVCAATQNRRRAIIASFYTWCGSYTISFRGTVRPILNTMSPTIGGKRRKETESDRDMGEEEVARFFKQIDRSTLIGKRDYAFFFALLITARRANEIAQLRWCDLEQVVFMDGSKPRIGHLYHWIGKGCVSRDSAEWPAACMDALKDYLEMAGKWGQMEPDDPLFVGFCGGFRGGDGWRKKEPVRVGTMDRRFRAYADAAGLPKSRVPHSFRHESAWCRYQENGGKLEKVQEDLRHANIQTTLGYLKRHIKEQQGDPIANRLASKFAHL